MSPNRFTKPREILRTGRPSVDGGEGPDRRAAQVPNHGRNRVEPKLVAHQYIPAGVAHGFRVGDTPSKKLNLYVPQAMVGYFDELAETIASGTVDDEHLGAIARRYGMEVLGPVPESYA